MKASEVLRAAKQKILDDGWMQVVGFADVVRHQGAHPGCVSNQLFEVEAPNFVVVDAHTYIAEAVGVQGRSTNGVLRGVYDWNDAPERTLTDVLDAFDMAVKLAEEDESFNHAPPTTYKNKEVKV